MKIRSQYARTLILFSILVPCLMFVSCSQEFWESLWNCVLGNSKCKCIDIYGDGCGQDDGGGINDNDWWDVYQPDSATDVVEYCDVLYLRVSMGGIVDREGYVWPALERNGELLSVGLPLPVDTPGYLGDYGMIPINGLDLDELEYQISVYNCEELDDIGERNKSYYRTPELARHWFAPEVRAMAKSRDRVDFEELKSGQTICLNETDVIPIFAECVSGKLTIKKGTKVSKTVEWRVEPEFGGHISLNKCKPSGQLTDHIASLVARKPGTCILIAEDTSAMCTGSNIDTITIQVDPCSNGWDCCSFVSAHAEFWKEKSTSCLVGAGGKFHVVYGQKLCGPPGYKGATASGLAWVTVLHYGLTSIYGHPEVWGQCGYGTWRFRCLDTVFTALYLEVMPAQGSGDLYKRKVLVGVNLPPPPANTDHTFTLELDDATGSWFAKLDGVVYAHYDSLATWQGLRGNRVKFAGESIHLQDDMPGTFSNRCRVSEMVWKEQGMSYDSVWVTGQAPYGGHRYETDPSEWRIEIDTAVDLNAIEIWDVNPRP